MRVNLKVTHTSFEMGQGLITLFFAQNPSTFWTLDPPCASLRADYLHMYMRTTWRNNTMGLMDKIKGLVGGNKNAVKGGIDKASGVVQSKTPDSIDDKVEMGSKKAKDIVDGL